MEPMGREPRQLAGQTSRRAPRFSGELEGAFRKEHREEVLTQRLLLLLIGALMVAAMPFIDAWLLEPPAAYSEHALWIEFGVILPALLLAFAFNADPRLRHWSDEVGLVALLVIVGGWSWLRYVGAQFGHEVPTLLIGVVLAGAFALAGLFFWTVAPVATLGLVLFATLEVWTYGSTPETLFNILAIMLLALITALGGYLQEHRARRHWWQRRELRRLSLTDGLTELANYRAFQDQYTHLHSVAARERAPLLVVAIDVDYFKQYNDRYGHQAGDECLRRIAGALASYARRSSDLLARTGGEEFMMVTSVSSEEGARRWMELLLQAVRGLDLPHAGRPDAHPGRVSISVGGVWGIPDAALPSHSPLHLADEQLYQAKARGRDTQSLGRMGTHASADTVQHDRLRLVRVQAAATQG